MASDLVRQEPAVRVTVLCFLDADGDAPDVVVDQVASALRAAGHAVAVLAVHDDLQRMVATLRRNRPDLVFNLAEGFGKVLTGDLCVPAVLDMLGLAYTGCGPGELYLAQDKVLSKKLLAFEGIACPKFAVFAKDASLETGGNLRLPLFVKPLRMDASIGIDTKSLVHDANDMMKRIKQIHDKVGDDALCEEYVDGREFYVGVLGHREPQALPVVEMDFSGLPQGAPHILDRKAKFDEKSKEFKGTNAVVADLPDELRARLQRTALDAFRAVRARDYGRVDLRMTEAGELYVLEVNANCYLEQRDEFPLAASAAGIDYPTLIQRIADLALARQPPRG